jgi:ATP-GRASP peptide maturase of grasp-with-spasm system
MILIFSERNDLTTNLVCDWLVLFQKEFLRINKEDTIEFNSYYLEKNKLQLIFNLENTSYSLSDFKTIWFRRGGFNFKLGISPNFNHSVFFEDYSKIRDFVIDENRTFSEFIQAHVESFPNSFGSFAKRNLNKLLVLRKAQKYGLKIPDELITSSKKDLLEFYIKCDERLISKAIKENISYNTDFHSIYHVNKKVELVEIETFKESFSLTFFQKYYEKIFEIRTFYFCNEFYSIAIMSQLDDQTKEDYRNYNLFKQTRCLNFNLPKHIKKKLSKLFYDLKLDSGSVDLIYTSEGEFIFLEINPIGQFGIVARSTNIQIEKKIASKISN